MKKYLLFSLIGMLLSATPLFAQMSDPGGSGGFNGGAGAPDSNLPGTAPQTPHQGGPIPCPPGSTAPELNQGDRGGLQNPNSGGGMTPGNPNIAPPPGSVPPNPQGSVPQNPQGSVPNLPGTPGDQGGLTQPGDQFGMTDCPPSGTDRGGLNNRSGQDLPGSDRATPPPLLPPSGGVQ